MRSLLAHFIAAISFAAIGTSVTSAAFGQTSPGADPATIEEAKRHMQAGAAFYNDPSGHKCEEAIREFGRAYELSGSLNALKGQAVCNLELERDGAAIEQYTRYLLAKGAAIEPADKLQVETDLNTLRASAAFVQFSTDHTEVRLTDTRTPARGFPITNRYTLTTAGLALGLHPGQHTITASTDGAPDLTWTLEIINGARLDHAFEFDKGKPAVAVAAVVVGPVAPRLVAHRPLPPSVLVTGGLTLALAIPLAIFGSSALGQASDYKKANGHESKVVLDGLAADVKRANLLTDLFLGATVAGAAATTILYLTRPTKMVPEDKGNTLKMGRINVLPTLGRDGGGAVIAGAF